MTTRRAGAVALHVTPAFRRVTLFVGSPTVLLAPGSTAVAGPDLAHGTIAASQFAVGGVSIGDREAQVRRGRVVEIELWFDYTWCGRDRATGRLGRSGRSGDEAPIYERPCDEVAPGEFECPC